MSNHLKTAHEYGVKKALEKAGYASVDEVNKDVQELGLLDEPKTASTTDAVFAGLKAKLG